MMLNRARLLSAAALLLAAAPAAGQAGSGVAAPCSRSDVPQAARNHCLAAAQALESGQPQLGILVAGGNPTLGSASTGGLRLGFIPRVNAGVSAHLVVVEIPDILADRTGGPPATVDEALGFAVPAIAGTLSVSVFDGVSAGPSVGGIGSIDLIGTATWLPFSAAEIDGLREGAADVAWATGARVGVLRESFVTPGVSVSLVYRRLGEVAFGAVCPSAAVATAWDESAGYSVESGTCPTSGDPGEFAIDLTDWSARALVGKRLLGLGLAGGIGYDRFSSDVAFGFRTSEQMPLESRNYFRVSDMDLTSGRWSAFVNGSLTLLVASVALEAGWMQGDDPIAGFPAASDFEPGDGTFFGSVGVRLAL